MDQTTETTTDEVQSCIELTETESVFDDNTTLNNNVEFSNLEELSTIEQDSENGAPTSQTTEEQPSRAIDVEKDAEESLLNGNAAITDESYFQQSLVELGRRLWPSTSTAQNYTKGCLWSPDGTCLLMAVHLDGMHVVELPADMYTFSADRKVHSLPTAVYVKEGGTVYDYVWYPSMSSADPASCVWLSTRQHEPIHMWDAFSGELRCSYRGYDEVDEMEAAISVAFANDGQRVLGGYKKSIKVFDTNIPGRDCSSIKVKQSVSCFALTNDNDNTITTGSWNGYIQHYDLRAAKLGALFTLGGHSGGITWLRYAASSANGWLLFSGARRDNKLLQWDMRNYKQPVREFFRTVTTNQRIHFDLSAEQSWLVSGDTGGLLRVWNLHSPSDEALALPLHADCLNGVSFHPSLPILATSSGQYHFVDVTQEDECPPTVPMADKTERIVDYENALLFLWVGAHSAADNT